MRRHFHLAFEGVPAVSGVSLEVKSGQIVGFLGPNGAGKSTTMKIATCYLQPDQGTILVNGLDVLYDQKQIRFGNLFVITRVFNFVY